MRNEEWGDDVKMIGILALILLWLGIDLSVLYLIFGICFLMCLDSKYEDIMRFIGSIWGLGLVGYFIILLLLGGMGLI